MKEPKNGYLSEFLHELAVAKELQGSPYIVKLLATVDGPRPRSVMEYLPLGSLEKYLEKINVPCSTLLQFAIDIAHGLCHIHSLDYRHCDIATRNILVTIMDDNELHAKISDFDCTKKRADCNTKEIERDFQRFADIFIKLCDHLEKYSPCSMMVKKRYRQALNKNFAEPIRNQSLTADIIVKQLLAMQSKIVSSVQFFELDDKFHAPENGSLQNLYGTFFQPPDLAHQSIATNTNEEDAIMENEPEATGSTNAQTMLTLPRG